MSLHKYFKPASMLPKPKVTGLYACNTRGKRAFKMALQRERESDAKSTGKMRKYMSTSHKKTVSKSTVF